MMNCPELRDCLSEYLDGELTPALMSECRAHLETCEECAAAAAQFRRLIHGTETLPDPEPPESLRQTLFDLCFERSEQYREREILNVDELMDYLGVTEEDLAVEIETMPAFEFAGQLRFRKKDIDTWVEKRIARRKQAIEASQLQNLTRLHRAV